MYVKLQSSYQVITLPNDYLTLKNVNGDELTFELRYTLDQEIAVKKGISNVKVDVAKNTSPSVSGMNPTKTAASSIQMQRSDHARLIKKYNEEFLLLSIVSDPTKSISNEVVPLYRRGYATSQIPQLKRTALAAVHVQNGPTPVTPPHFQHDLAISNQTQHQIAEELLLKGYDPSSSYEVNDLGLTLAEAHRGIHRKSPSVFNDAAEKAMYKYKTLPYLKPILQPYPGDPGLVIGSDAPGSEYTLQRKSVEARYVTVKDTLKFAVDAGTTDKLVLTMNVKDANGVTVQQLTRVFYPREYVKYYNIPTKIPVVKMSVSANKTHAMLAVKQVDQAATKIRVYRRIYDHHVVSDEPYVFISEFDLLPAHGWKYLPVEISLGNTTIYRVVPVNNLGVVGTDYASTVVKPQMTNGSIKRVVTTTKPQPKSVLLEVSKLPSDAVSFHMMREDTSNHGAPEFVGAPTMVETPDPNRVYVVEDTTVKRNHVYAYHCRIYRRNGSHEQRLVTHYEHIPLVENIVETKIIDPRLTFGKDGYDVKFTLKTIVVKSKIDQIKQLLEKQGLYNLFTNDVADVRDQLGKLISYNVKRVDLTTGAVEDFGTVDDDVFSDLEIRRVTGVSDLKHGRKYRYVVAPLLRAPETLLESYTKIVTDDVTKRSYSFKPFKFLHPVAMLYGNIATPSSIRKNYSKDPMTFGEIGAYVTTEIALDKEKITVAAASLEKRGIDVDVINWSLQNSSMDVDHFQVIVEHDGKKMIVGKSTCVPETENFAYVRRLDKTEIGLDLRYYICPVYLDFTRGTEIMVSNVSGVT